MTPPAFLFEFLGAVGLLFYATRLEHDREIEETPRIIRPWSEPERPKRHWLWIKIALVSGSISLVGAISVFLLLRHGEPPASNAINHPELPSVTPTATVSTPSDSNKQVQSPKRTASRESTAQPKAASVANPSPPPLIIPSSSASRPFSENKGAGQPTASIGGKALSASDKAPGTLYVSVRLAEVSRYRGTFDEQSVDAVKIALEQTKKISVFTGAYDIGKSSGRRYGIGGIAPSKARTIFYFDKTLDNTCAAVQRTIAAVIGMAMECQFFISFLLQILTLTT